MNKRVIVVVERNAMLRDTLVEALTEIGYSVYGVMDTSEAKAIVDYVVHPCLILADLSSTGMSLSDFLQVRCTDLALAQIPVAIMSSLAVEPDEKAILQAHGARNYLKKPFDLDLLLKAVEEHCSEA
jgi:CheY-like chemotaxis protein